jgi:glycosyltransferase involved in cell wall biosynthesis
VDHPVLSQPWLGAAVLLACGLVVFSLWRKGVGTPKVLTEVPPTNRPLPTVAVVVPVLNEAHVLQKSIQTLLAYLRESFPYPAQVIIADNGSKDGTGDIARELARRHEDVKVISLQERGRGRALRAAWTGCDADIVAYMDVDLSTELAALETLCRGIHEEGYDLATGSRLLPGSRVTRCLRREVLSQGYNLFIKAVLFTRFSDAQCGFKAVSRRVVEEVVPLIENQHWFFDTEPLVLGEKLGYRIKDVPVAWVEDTDSRVKILSTVWEDIKGVFRLRWLLWGGRLSRPSKARGVGQPPAREEAAATPMLDCVPVTR